jgi:hypothetical protein
MGLLGRATTAVGNVFVGLAEKITGTGYAATQATRSFNFFGKALQVSTRTLVAFGAGFVAFTAVTVAALAVAKEWREMLQQIDRQTLITSQGVDRLADSMGIVIDPLEAIAAASSDTGDINARFTVANADLLKEVQDTLILIGEQGARDQIISIAYQLSSRGGSVDDVEAFIKRIQEVTGIEIDLTNLWAQIENGSAPITSITSSLDKAIASLKSAGLESNTLQGLIQGLDGPTRTVQNRFKDLADQLVQVRLEEGPEKFADAMAIVTAALEGTAQEDFFVDSLLDSFNTAADGATDFSTQSADSFTDFWNEFARGIPFLAEMDAGLADVEAAADATNGALVDMSGGLASDIEEYGIVIAKHLPGVIQLTDDQLSSLHDLRGEIGSILEAGQQYIVDHFNEMNSQIKGQAPLLGIYEGAVKQSFSAWKRGQIQFRQDLDSVTEARDKLVEAFGPNSALVDAFDQQPISEQAWLAALSPANFTEAVKQLALTDDATTNAVKDRLIQDNDEILIGVRTAMGERYQELYNQAAEAGDGVADLWLINFERQSAQWVVSAQSVMGQVAAVLRGELPGPTVGGIDYDPFSPSPVYNNTPIDDKERRGTSNVTVNVYNPVTQNLPGDTDRALKIARTYGLSRK